MEFKLTRQSNPDINLGVYSINNGTSSPLMIDNETFLSKTHELLAWVEEEFGTEDDWSYEVKRITTSYGVESLDISQDPVAATDSPEPVVNVSHTLTLTLTTPGQIKLFEKAWV